MAGRLFFFLIISVSYVLLGKEQVALPMPDFSEAEFKGYGVGIRPARKGGIRLEVQSFGDKVLIHNYGHGGRGITLSWGSAVVATELLDQIFACETPSVAILGGGIIGLSTAHELLDKGYEVTLYAAAFPPCTTSNMAVGIYEPPNLVEDDLRQKLYALSYVRFQALATNVHPEFCGVSLIDVYSFGVSPERKEQLTNSIEVDVTFDNKITYQGVKWQTFRIEGDIYLQSLLEKAMKKGATCVQCCFSSQEELHKLEEKVIVNCTGYGAKTLFKDRQLIPVRGHLLFFSPQPEIDYILGFVEDKQTHFFFAPWKSKLILGGEYEKGEEACCIDKETCYRIWSNAINFFCPN